MSQKTSLSLHPKPLDQPFLSRHQTDEWKGWMQVIILVYHYTGASKVLAIYEFVRLLVASYIFMTGFGHTVYFYRKSDYSLRRCAAVLIRLNMLSCVLPYIMKTDYMFYYFAPLISFWYVVIFLTMAAGHSRNDSLAFLLVKIFIAASLTSTLIMVPGMFELVFEILQKCCNIHWNVEEWRFRLQLDSYIVYIGMFCGIGFVRITDALRAEHLEDGTLGDLICQLFWLLSILARAIACVVPPIYYLFGRQAPNKYAYNEWVPYVSAAPILSFVIFRNISRRTRNSHSSIFAWIGRHSLETFTLQFHIWLAADTKGLLALGVLDTLAGGARGGRVADLLVLTVIFFWVCWHVGAAIQTLTSWIIDPSEGREDLVVDESVNIVEERFPGTKSREDLRPLGHISRIAGRVGAEAIRSAIRSKRFVAGDLRVRLGVILGIMWMLNVVSNSWTNPWF